MKHALCLVFILLVFVNCVRAVDTHPAKAETEKSEALTFRILASRAYPQDEDIIRRGIAESGRNICDPFGKIVARWITIVDSQKSSFENPNMVIREHENTLEALVKYDDGLDISGEHLKYVGRWVGQSGNLGIAFSFDAVGAHKFGLLTSRNRPDPIQTQLSRYMGIILNDSLYSAPVIRSTIRESGIIEFNTGDTDAERQKLNHEIDDMIEVLQTRYLSQKGDNP